MCQALLKRELVSNLLTMVPSGQVENDATEASALLWLLLCQASHVGEDGVLHYQAPSLPSGKSLEPGYTGYTNSDI